MNSNQMIESTLCSGCMSVDRKLQLLTEEYKQYFCGLLNVTHSPPISLCFECLAIMQRLINFKIQVNRAHNFLDEYLRNRNKLKPLSRLECSKTVVFDNDCTNVTKDLNIVMHILKNNEETEISNACASVIKIEYNTDQKSYSTDQESQKTDKKSYLADRKSQKTDQKSYLAHHKSQKTDQISYLGDHKSQKTDQKSYLADHKSQKTDQKSYLADHKSQKTDQTLNRSEQNCTEPLAFIKVEELQTDVDNDGFYDLDCEYGPERQFSDSDDEPLTRKSNKQKRQKKRLKDKQESTSPKRRKEQRSGVVSDPRVAKKLRDLNIGDGHIALVLLTWEEVEEERKLLLASSRFTAHAHRCAHCIVGYNHKHKLVEHNKKHSLEAGPEVCDVCTIRCKSRAALASHKRRHRARWVCQYCGARYSQACVAGDHCARAHGAARPTHRCPHCTHTDTSLGALRMHIKSHLTRPECALCGKTFRDKSSLRTHAFVHKGVKEHACSVCDKTFMFKKQKEIHETTHLEHQHLYCHQCDVSFKNQTSYYQHMKYNLKHIDPVDIKYACQVCDKRFVKAKRLEEHNLAVHLKLAPIKCTVPDCAFSCPSRASLRSHMRVTHRGAKARVTHVCHRCGHTYKSKKSLEGHLRSHDVTSQTTNVAALS